MRQSGFTNPFAVRLIHPGKPLGWMGGGGGGGGTD